MNRLSTLALLGAGLPALALGAATNGPVALSDPASSTARLAAPAPPGRIEIAAGAASARVENRVAPGSPTSYLFLAPPGRMVSIGISSPRGDVRLSILEVASGKTLAGADPAKKTIRWISSFEKPTELRLTATAEGTETPFRFDVGAGSVDE